MERPNLHAVPEPLPEPFDPSKLTSDCSVIYELACSLNEYYTDQQRIITEAQPAEKRLDSIQLLSSLAHIVPPPETFSEVLPPEAARFLSEQHAAIAKRSRERGEIRAKLEAIIASYEKVYELKGVQIDYALKKVDAHTKIHRLSEEYAAQLDQEALERLGAIQLHGSNDNTAANNTWPII